MTYTHPREIEDFENLATESDSTIEPASSGIALLKDGDGPRDWALQRGSFFDPERLGFTVVHRPSPSSMATQYNFELYAVGVGDDLHWWLADVDRFTKQEITSEEVAKLVPKRFALWLKAQGQPRRFPWSD